jgi:hypothetical protein
LTVGWLYWDGSPALLGWITGVAGFVLAAIDGFLQGTSPWALASLLAAAAGFAVAALGTGSRSLAP